MEGQVGATQVNAIRFLVANAVENLRSDDVAVVDHHGTALTDGLKEDSQPRLRFDADEAAQEHGRLPLRQS